MARTTAIIPVGADTRRLEKDIQIALSKDFKLKGLNEKAFSQPLGRITGASNEFQKSLDASNARVIAFGASAGLIYVVEKAFTDLIRTTIDVEKSIKDINVILNASQGSLKNFTNELFNIAKDTGQTFQSVASAATELARQGLGVEETLKRTKDALILTRLSGLDTVSSVEALTAAVNSFSKVGIDSTTVINKLANVDAAFAVSSGDLANALQRVGSTALDAGVSFDELLAIVTSVQQTTARGGAVIGNSLKTIFTRIQRTDTLDALSNLGIQVKDLQGNTLPALAILEQLARKFDTLSDAQRSAVAEQVGGVFQINILKAALGDLSKEYSIYKNALDVAGSSTDEAIQRNKELNETVAALLNKTLANITRVGTEIGATAFQPTISGLLSTLNKGLESISLDTETTGGKIGKGIVEGIGTFISGPGVILLTAVLGKLFLNLSKFAIDSLKSLLSLNRAGEQRALIQQRILEILTKEPQIVTSILSKESSLLQVENQILNTIRAQTLERQKAATIASQLTTNLVNRGVSVGKTGVLTTRTKSEGHIPEIYGALAGGYMPGEIKKMVIPGEGQVIYNTAEEVKKFPGATQPAIMPPEKSNAGERYKENFYKRYGFDPYASQGFIPNFALTGSALQKYIQQEYSKKGFLAISTEEAAVAKTSGIPVKYLYGDTPFIDQRYRTSLTNLYKKSEEGKAGARATAIKEESGITGFSNKRPYGSYGVIFPSFGQDTPGISAGYVKDAERKTRAYRFRTFPFPGRNFDINEKLYEDVRKNLVDISSSYFRGLITKPQIIDTSRFKTNIQSNLSRSAVESSLGQVFEAGIKASISSITLSEIANFDLDTGELDRIKRRFKLPYGGFGVTSQADLKNSLSRGNLDSMAGKIYRFENPVANISKGKSRYEGFIPNFAGLQTAIETEAAMGGKPVIDFDKNIGVYVRDGNTQRNFNDVKRDHPEGIKNAIKNSKKSQRKFNRGFVPQFLPIPQTLINPAAARSSVYAMESVTPKAVENALWRTADSATKFRIVLDRASTKLTEFNENMNMTITTIGFLGPSVIQTAAQFAPQDARTQNRYNTASQMLSYGSLGFGVGAGVAPFFGPAAPFVPIVGAAAGVAYGAYTGGKQGEEALKREKLDLLGKELGILQDRFNSTQGALQQTMPLIEQYKNTLTMQGPPDIKQANLDILYEKIVDSVSGLPVDIQNGVFEKIKEGKFEEIGSVIAETMAKGAAEIKSKELEMFFESLSVQSGIKTKEEARVAAKALLDIRSEQTGLRYTTTLAKTEEGRKKIDDVISELKQLSGNIDLKNAGVEVDENGQITLSRKVLPYSPPIQTPAGPVQPAGTSPFDQKYQEEINKKSREAALSLQSFVDVLRKIYTDADGKVAPEFSKVAEKAIKIAISSGNLQDAVDFATDELMRTKAAAGKLTENITHSIETVGQFIERYRQDIKRLSILSAKEAADYAKKLGRTDKFDPANLLGTEFEKQLNQINLDVLNQDERDKIINEVTEQEYILRQKLKDRIITEDQYRNALLSIIESEKTKSKRDQGLMFADQYKQERQQQREARLLAGKSVSDGRKALDVGDAFFTEFDYRTEDLYRDLQNGAIDTARTMKSEFGNAFQSIIDNSQSAEDAFRNMALNIARRIQQLALDAAVSQIFSSLFQGTGLASFFSFKAGGLVKGYNKGGLVKNYSSGGRVEGGTGYKDDVFSMLTGGEYVIKKSAVKKYGTDVLDKLNKGRLLKKADGGVINPRLGEPNASNKNPILRYKPESTLVPYSQLLAEETNRTAPTTITDLPGENIKTGSEMFYEGKAVYAYNDPFRPTAGELIMDPNLSTAALFDKNNPQTDIRQKRFDSLQEYIGESIRLAEENRIAEEEFNKAEAERKAEIDAMNRAQRDAFNNWRKSQLMGGGVQAALILGGGAFNAYAAPAIKNWLSPGGGNPFKAGNLLGSDTVRRATPDSPRDQFAGSKPSGGRLPVGRSKGSPIGGEKDDIPALLMGGEYVINKQAVDEYGSSFFDQLNSGRIKKFADGGYVGEGQGGGQGKNTTIESEMGGASDIVNNININVSIAPNGAVAQQVTVIPGNAPSMNTTNKNTSQSEVEKAKDFADRVKSEVIKVINEQQRLGGILRR